MNEHAAGAFAMVGWAGLVVTAIAYSFWARRRFPSEFAAQHTQGTRFRETRVSAVTTDLRRKSFIVTGGTLEIIVTDTELWVRPGFTAGLVFASAESELQHRVPLERIAAVRQAHTLAGKHVGVEFTDDGGGSHTLRLRVKQREAFLAALPSAAVYESSLLRPSGQQAAGTLLRAPSHYNQEEDAAQLVRPYSNESGDEH